MEVVISLVILSLLSGALYGAFHLGAEAVPRGERMAEWTQRVRVSLDMLTRQVKSTNCYPARSEEGDMYPYFLGDGETLSFVTSVPHLGSRSGLAKVDYVVRGGALYYSEQRLFGPDVLGAEAEEGPVFAVEEEAAAGTLLFGGFSASAFEYLFADGIEEEWLTSWDGQETGTIPAAVRLNLEGLLLRGEDVWVIEIPVLQGTYQPGEDTCDALLARTQEQREQSGRAEGGDGQDGERGETD